MQPNRLHSEYVVDNFCCAKTSHTVTKSNNHDVRNHFEKMLFCKAVRYVAQHISHW